MATDVGGTTQWHPGLSVDVGRGLRDDQFIGYVSRTNLHFHDFQAVGNGYLWYFEGDAEQTALRVGLLWPGFFVMPLAGATMSSSMGLRFRLR